MADSPQPTPPVWKSPKFWFAFIAILLSAVVGISGEALPLFPPDSLEAQIFTEASRYASTIMAALAALGYAVSQRQK